MTPEVALELVRRTVMLGLLVAAPLLAVALLVGVIISLLQAVTQVQEQTLTFIPKLLALGFVTVLILPWMLRELVEFTVTMIQSLPGLVG